MASQEGQVEIVRMLIEHGADVTSRNEDEETPLHVVSNPFSAKSWRFARVASILLKHGADVNAKNVDGLTPFRLASQRGFEDITDVLLEYGADRHDTSELPGSGSPPVTSQGSPADPLTRLTDSPISSHPSLTNPNVADRNTDLPQTPPSFPPSSSNDVLTSCCKRDPPPVYFSRRFLCSLVLAIVAVALPFLIRSVPRAPAVGRTT